MRLSRVLLVPAVLAMAAGCGGGPKFAPVSGRVTMNGQPLTDAFVEFQPVAPSKNVDPGPGSVGKTDKDGRYSLYSQLNKDQPGAVAGKHRVRISTWDGSKDGQDRDADGPRKKGAAPNVPAKYNEESELTFEVPTGGSDKADFTLTK